MNQSNTVNIQGIWTRRDKGLPPAPTSRSRDSVEPNRGHLGIVELEKLGKLKFLISQNVDNLHLKSGIALELLAELHGNITKLRCTRCAGTTDRSAGLTNCQYGGKLVSSVVNFGDTLPKKDLELSFDHSRRSDLFIVLGSSLVVTPAADMPKEALRSAARLVIINKDKTPFDSLAHLRFHKSIGHVLRRAVKGLKN